MRGMLKMSWKHRFLPLISSNDNKPKKGMKVKAIKPIDGKNEIVGNIGTVIRDGFSVVVAWDNTMDCGYRQYGYENTWNGSTAEWNDGCYQILK
jgi:hypothetical protein